MFQNHDLDFGIAQFVHLRNQCNFPWLLANVLDPALGNDVPLAHCEKTHVISSSNGIKVGFIGLAEREWWVLSITEHEYLAHCCRLETINALPPNLIYKSASATAEELVPGLRDQGCEIVIALTHMREPNDLKLAQQTSDGLLELILGGHDHYYNHEVVKSTHILRSGTDFRQLSYIEAWKREDGQWDFSITRRDIVRSIPEDPEFVQLVEKLNHSLRGKLNKPIGYTATPLDARFTTVRLRESNLGSFVCDIMRHYYDTDCALMASGTIRGDQVYPPGVLRMKDIMICFPFEDPVVVLRVSGQALLDALENSVSPVPALEGRFPQVSNIVLEYSISRPAGSRIIRAEIDKVPLEESRFYTVATRGYMAHGKDGFDSLLARSEGGQAEEIVSEENGILISTMLRQYFLSLKVLGRWRRWPSLHRHWEEVHSKLHQDHEVLDSSRPLSSSLVKSGPGASEDEDPLADGIDAASVRHRAPGAFHHAGRVRHLSKHKESPVGGHDMIDSDSDGSVILHDSAPPSVAAHPLTSDEISSQDDMMSHEESDRLYHLARSYGKRWMALAGVEREGVGVVDDHEHVDIPSWTRGIAPKVEGRVIQLVD